jgi:DNA-binding transcriptional ArsR family regulator
MAKTPTSDGPWLSRAFLALSDPLRREIIEEIIINPSISVSDICARYPVSRFTIMRHLNILEDGQLLYRKRDGNAKRLYIDQSNIEKLANGWLLHIREG